MEVRLCSSPEGTETFVLCRSLGGQEKENAILNRFMTRLEEKLIKLAERAKEGKIRDRQKVERQIGRLLERNGRAAALFTVTVTEKDGCLSIDIRKNGERYEWALETGGSYILRTTKHDLGMRPIFHQKKDRTQAHIQVCFLSLALWRTLQQWMKASGLGTAPRKPLTEMKEIKSLDVLLPAKDKTIRLRMAATAPPALRILLQRMKILLPNKPRIIENVVQKNTLFLS